MNSILHLFVPIFWAILLVLLVTPPLIRLAIRFGYVDDPQSAPHKIHDTPKPMIGGIVIGFVVLFLVWVTGNFQSLEVKSILFSALVVLAFGILDDLRGLSVLGKLMGQILATTFVVVGGIYIRIFGPDLFVNILVTFVWVVGITNAFNLVDSMDGLVVGLTAIASAFFILVTVQANQQILANLSAILLGSSIGMLFFNGQPARTFLGDAGAQFLGFVLANLAIVYTPPGFPQPSSWFVPILLLGVPIFDSSLVVISRLRKGLPFYQSGQDHTYHRLVKLGLSPSHAVMLMHITSILIGCLAFIALLQPPLIANLLFGMVVLTEIFALIWLEKMQG